jgi:hypothetical protein
LCETGYEVLVETDSKPAEAENNSAATAPAPEAASEAKVEPGALSEVPQAGPPPINWCFLGWVAIFTLIAMSIGIYFVRIRSAQVESPEPIEGRSDELVETPEIPHLTQAVGEIRFSRSGYAAQLPLNELVTIGDMFELKKGAHLTLRFMDGSTIEAAAVNTPGVVNMYACQPVEINGARGPFNTFMFQDLEVTTQVPEGKVHRFMLVTKQGKADFIGGRLSISIKNAVTRMTVQNGEATVSLVSGQAYNVIKAGDWVEMEAGRLPHGPTIPEHGPNSPPQFPPREGD